MAGLLWTGLLILAGLAAPAVTAQELGRGELQIAGTQLTASPESQTVPLSTPTIVETELTGWSVGNGTLPADLVVTGELSGPEISGYLTLTTRPGEPFRIPRLSLEGEYRLENIRLVQGGELLSYAVPRDVGILVTQVLVTRVSSRPLTLEEVRSYGVVLGDENFRAFNFTFGFAVDGEVIDYNLPVLYNALDPGATLTVLGGSAPQFGASSGTTSPRFKPPQMAPFTLQVDRSGGGGAVPTGGCQGINGCSVAETVSLPGVILFPSEVSLLNQFFSVVLVAKNDAPQGDPLVIRDLTARVVLPPGLRMAETEPPTPLGVPVPVRVPGADGELGTGDDLTFLVAQAEGQAEVLVEGRQQGSHVVEFQLEGVLDGLPGGVERITGLARGAVVVRDPTLAMTVTHPDVVRDDEEYTLSVTVSNTSNVPVNLLSVSLPPGGLSGVELLSAGEQTVPTLLPGDAEVVEFQLRSLRTGRVVASSVKVGSAVDPSFELVVGVGDAGIPLSPDALILPRPVGELPAAVQRHALGLLGLGFSLSTAPEPEAASGLPRLSREQIDEKAYWLAQAGRHVGLGEEPFDSLAVTAAEWAGARDADWEWDALRRITRRGGLWADALAQTFAAEASATSARAAFERFAATTAFLGRLGGTVAAGDGARLELASRTTGDRLAGEGIDPLRTRELAFGDLYGLGADGQMALLAAFEDGGYQVRLTAAGGTADALTLWVPDDSGGSRLVDFAGVALPAGGLAVADFAPADDLFTLYVDRDGDGVVDEEIPGAVSSLAPRPFTAVAAVQNAEEDPSGHIVDVLLTQDLDLSSLLPLDPARFTLPGKVSNGGLVPVEEDLANFFETVAENPFEGLRNSRIVRVIFDNPLSPYVTHDLTVRDLDSVAGAMLANVTLPVTTTVTEPGTRVEGTVFGPDGEPVPFALVELYEVDFFYHFPTPCRRHKTAAVRTDAEGRYAFDYVRQTRCSDVFTVVAADPVSGHRGDARGRMRFAGGSQALDVLMLGRGTLRGRVTYEDGTVPESLRVTAYSPVFYEGREARVFADGRYEVGEVPVGTVSLAATDREGSFVYQTEELPTAGAVVERDLVILRRSPEETTGDVRGTVVETDGVTPVFDAYVALYVDGELAGVERSGLDGSFDFGTVPTGGAEIEAFDGETGLSGAQIYFEVAADQVHDLTVLLSDERGAVEGHVYRQEPGGPVPVEGAVVWVSGTPFSTVTDAAGSYSLDGVFAGQRTILAADLDHQVQTSAAVTVNGGGAVTYRDLTFPGETVGSGITGEVVGFTGNPVSGARVHIATGGGQWWHEAVTDTLGRFTLPDLTPGTYELHAVAGTAGASKTVTIRFEGETPFVRLQFKKGTIRGTVRFEDAGGQPVGVQSLVTYRTTVVQAGLVGLDWEPRTIETEPDGSFEIPDALIGPYSLHVSNPFHGERRVSGELVFHGEVAEHDVLFQENGTIRVRVLDWDGETPVAGVRVDLQHPAFGLYDLFTDADGRATFELVPPIGGRFPIEAEITSGTIFRRARVWVRFARFGEELDVEIVMPRQGTVSGRVEDSNGNPVPGAVVSLREHAFPGRHLTHNADGDGRFRFTNVFAGTVSLAATAPSLGGLGSKATVELTAEGDEVTSLLALEATGEIVGRVLSPVTGEPVPSVEVSLYRHGGGLFDSVTAGPDGAFRFRLLPLGQYRVWVFDPATGRHGEREGAWVEFNDHVREADVTLEVRGAIDGHLSDPGSGTGVPGATIRASVSSLVPFVTYSSTDVDGYFEFLGIPESNFRLDTREPEGRRRASGSGSIGVEGERVTVDLVLEASGSVTGTVLAPPGGSGGAFANVNTLVYQDGQVVGASLDNPFTFTGLIAERSFRLIAREVGGEHRGEASGRITSEGELATVDVTMRPIGEAEVTVRDSFGDLIAGADVGLRSSGYYRQGPFAASTGPDGTALFTGVGEGHLSAWASNPVTSLAGSAQGTLTLEGERVPLEIQLADSGAVIGRVLLSDGATPAEEALVVLTVAGRTLQTFAAADGSFRFEAAPLGTFTVFAQQHFGPGTARVGGALTANGELVDVGTLVMDDADPFVVELTPALYAVDRPLSTAVSVRFSEPMDTARFAGSWVDFRKLSGATVAYSASWSEGDTVLTLTPTAPLASHTGYQLTVVDGYDPAGRRLFEPARTIFTTVDVIPPTVIDVLPRDGQNQIETDAQIRLVFSEPIVPASLNGSALQLTDLTGGTGVATTWLLLADDREALITPVGGLQTDREYQLTVQGLEDGSGNVMTTPVTTTFWTLDTTPPAITDVAFPAGTDFTAGDDVPVAVTATDLWGVASVTVRVGEWAFADDEEPFEPVALAPVVTAPESVTLTLEATDVHGNVGSTTRTIQVEPLGNSVVPEVWASCAFEGDSVLAGREVEIGLSAEDDQAVESLTAFVDGVEVGTTSPINSSPASTSFLWTPPVDAVAGDVYAVRLEARDFAGNVSSHELSLEVPAGTVLIGSQSLLGPYDGEDLVLAEGTFLVRDPLTFASLRVMGSAEIVAPDDTPELELTATDELRVQCGASIRHGAGGRTTIETPGSLVVGPDGAIEATGLGYRGAESWETDGQAPTWVAASQPDSGGSHGGPGAVPNGVGPAGEIFDSVYEPTLGGGGGARRCGAGCSGPGGTAGGGVVEVEAANLVLEGEISARGAVGGGGETSGAGGSVWVRVGQVSGRGRLDASGGDSLGCTSTAVSGSGGGGRVALHVSSASELDLARGLWARGGRYRPCSGQTAGWASAGTAYALLPGMTFGWLSLSNGEPGASVGRVGRATELPALGAGDVSTFTPDGADAWVGLATTPRPRWRGAWVALEDAAGLPLGTFRVADLDAAGNRLLLAGAANVPAAARYQGLYRFDSLRLVAASLAASDPVEVTDVALFDGGGLPAGLSPSTLEIRGGTVELGEGYAVDTATIGAGTVVVPTPDRGILRLEATGDLTIEAGAILDVDGLGYASAQRWGGPELSPVWVAASTGKAGGSHGGSATTGNDGGDPGEVYDSVYEPRLPGGAGPSEHAERAGGVVVLAAGGTLRFDGEIRASGESATGHVWPAAAGGAVALRAGVLQGAGTIDASGGESPYCANFNSAEVTGSGGGGRVAIHAATAVGFDPAAQVTARGGVRAACSSTYFKIYAGPGTILSRLNGQLFGTLRIDGGEEPDGSDRDGSTVELPALGPGGVVAVEDTGPDAWITPDRTLHPRWLGAWMALEDAAGSRLGSYRVAEIDASGRARLESAAPAAASAVTFRGEYRFDRIELLHGAGVTGTDPIQAPDYVFDGPAEVPSPVIAQSVVLRSGARLSPANGGELHFQVSGSMVVEAGAVIDVTGRGYAGGTDGGPGETAPGVVPAGHDTGGSHGGIGIGSGGAGTPGELYDSVYRPRLAGGGGGSRTGPAWSGGGVVRIEAGELVLDGSIVADGGAQVIRTTGAGGAVEIDVAGTLSGSGQIEVLGGTQEYCGITSAVGIGGGGRIGIRAAELSGFDPAVQARAWGGGRSRCGGAFTYAGSGSVYYRAGDATYGALVLDNGTDPGGNARSAPVSELPALGTGTLTEWSPDGTDVWVATPDGFGARWLGAWLVVLDASGDSLGGFEVVELDAAGRARIAGAAGVSAAASFRGEYRFDRIDLLHGASLAASDPVVGDELVLEGDVAVPPVVTVASLRIKSGATIRPASGSGLRFEVSGPLVIETGAVVDVSGFGYPGGDPGGAPAGVAGASPDAGGSHGGVGRVGNYPGPAGEVYGNVFAPDLPGGGGADRSGCCAGESGGGVVSLTAGQLVLDGDILAQGAENLGPAGAGGSVHLVADQLSGMGTVNASGSNHRVCSGRTPQGVGGGGRVAVEVGSFAGFDPDSQILVRGGSYSGCSGVVDWAAPGTLFVRSGSATYGSLTIDPGDAAGKPVLTTTLPSIGRGVVGAVEADAASPADLWIEPADPGQLFDRGVVGLWVRIAGVDYRVLAEDETTRRRILLGGATGAVHVGDAFVGLYRLDSLTVTGGAELEVLDGLIADTLTVDPGSSFSSLDLEMPEASILSPAAGSIVSSGDLIEITAEATDNVGVTSVTFTLEDQSFTDTETPWEWSVPAPAVAAERDAVIEVEAVDPEGNAGVAARTIRIQPLVSGTPPVVAIPCPSAGALLAPGTGLDLLVDASHDDDIERVELFVDGAGSPAATDFTAPYVLRLDAPAGAIGGDTVTATVRATSFAGTTAETTLAVQIIDGAVLTTDTFLAAGDTSLDGGAVIVAGGTLTVEGPHAFTDLVVLDGAVVTHPPAASPASPQALDLTLGGDLFIGCAGRLDVDGQGSPVASSHGVFVQEHFGAALSTSDWQIVDQGTHQGPSNWYTDDGHLRQTSNIRQPDGHMGTFALWAEELPVADYRLGLRMNSTDDDSIGVMFRYVDEDNYYRFRWSQQTPGRWLERIVDGERQVLASDSTPYTSSHWYYVEVTVEGSSIEVAIDGSPVLTANDSSHPQGRVALYSAGNAGSYFDNVRVTAAGSAALAVVARDHFSSSASLADWQIVDQGTNQAPSNWIWDNGHFRQTTNIHDPSDPRNLGTYAVWTGPQPGADFRLAADLYSGDDDAIGFMFRYRDPDNYYRFRWWRGSGGGRVLETMDGGQLTELAIDSTGYEERTYYRVEVEMVGPRMTVWVDGEQVLTAWDEALADGGVALYCYGNVNSYFDDFVLSEPLRTTAEGGSHGGRGGSFVGGGSIHGTLFDPADPGSGGGGPYASSGGGVVRLDVQGQVVIDGSVSASGVPSTGEGPAGAGGSIRLDASSVSGTGGLTAEGGAGSGDHAAGAGGRIAVYATSWDAGLPDRLSAAGGLGSTDDATGAAGTVYLKLDGEPFGDLILDNRGRTTSQITELPALLPGTVESATASTVTDSTTSFPDSLAGAEMYFDGDTGSLWTILGNDEQTLTLDTSQGPVSAQPGDAYAGLYRFGDVIVRGGARGIARNPVWTTGAPQVEAGSEWLPDYQPTLAITQPLAGASFRPGDSFEAMVDVTDRLGVASVRYTLSDLERSVTVPPYGWTTSAPAAAETGLYPLEVELTNRSGQTMTASVDVELRSGTDAFDVTIVAPAESTVFTSGQTVDVTATVDSAYPVSTVTFTLEDQSFTDTEAPWEWSVAAPSVATERDAVIEVAAVDSEGNAGAAIRTVRVQPLVSGTPPAVAIACPSAGALLAPDTGLDLFVDASHEDDIERVELFVDGASSPEVTDFTAPYVLRLDAPAGAMGGDTVTATVRATSFAGTTAETTLAVRIVDGAVITADTFLAAGDTNLDGAAVVVAGGTLTVEGPHAFTDLAVLDGAAVTHPSAAGFAAPERLELALSGDLFVGCGGSVDVAGRGDPVMPEAGIYAADHFQSTLSFDDWEVVDAPGASSGPSNWYRRWTGWVVQGSNINAPNQAGTHLRWRGELPTADYRVAVRLSSGDNDQIGLLFRYADADDHYRFRWSAETDAGRYLERVEDGVVTVLASDNEPYVTGRWYAVEVEAVGSGLSVRVDGEVVLTATDATHAAGTVALYTHANVNGFFDDFRVTAAGSAAPAVVARDHFASSASLADWQIVDQGTNQAPSNWIWDNGLFYQTTNIHDPSDPRGLGTYAVWTGPQPGADFRLAADLYSGDDDAIGLMFRYRDSDNYYRFRWWRGSGGGRVLETMDGGQLTELATDSTGYEEWTYYRVEVEMVGPRMTVWVDGEPVLTAWDEAHVDGGVALFCAGNIYSYFDDFVLTEPLRTGAEGGSHGGRGGSFLGGGAIHGTLFDPADPGSGGGGPYASAGGGVVRIDATGQAVIDGAIDASGSPSTGEGPAGAGGSIRLDASSISGTGWLTADGGAGLSDHAAGSGGRIAVYTTSWDAGLPDRLSAAGGLGSTDEATGAAGTVYLKLDGEPFGDLILDNLGRTTSQLTELPALLPGTVESATSSTVTDSAARFPDSLAGAELYFDGDTGSLWTVLGNDEQTLTLDTSKGSVSAQPGDAYAGLYRFGDVVVRGGARGIARNPVWTPGAPQVEAGSEWLPDYQPTVSITQPTDGASLDAGDLLEVEVSVTDQLGVASVRYTLVDLEHVASVPPYSWSLTVPDVATTATYPLTVEVTNRSGQRTVASIDVEIQP